MQKQSFNSQLSDGTMIDEPAGGTPLGIGNP